MPRQSTSFYSRAIRRFVAVAAPLLVAFSASAQRAEDGPPNQDPFRHPAAPEVPGGRYLSHSYQNGVLTIRATDGSTRQVRAWVDGVVKISYFAPGRLPLADSSVSVVQAPAAYRADSIVAVFDESDAPHFGYKWIPIGNSRFIPPQPLLQKKAASATPTTVYLTVGIDDVIAVDKSTLAVSWQDYHNIPRFSEATPAYRRQPTTLPDPNTPPNRINELAGTGVRFRLQPGERLYGTGSRALPLDRRGYRLELYNQAHYGYGNGEPALNVTMPVVLSSQGYMLLFDHHAAGYLDLGKKNPDALEYGVECLNSLSYFVITGDNQAEILNRYTALTGRQPLPPRWALGLIQSRFGYRSQAEMLNVASQMRRNNFPLDGLVLDLFWFGGTTRQGDFAWDAANFPDPAGMMRTLKTQGVNTILISEPYVMRTSRNDSLVRTLGLVGTTARGKAYTVGSFWAGPASILDVFKPETRTWMWAQYQRLHDQGAAGWWSDLGEPENHPEAMHHVAGTTRQVHNAYGITWAKIFQDNYAKEYPDERLFNLARSGWAGMQRNSVFPWSGDISRTWSGLQAQVPIMLSMGQVGVGYMHSDAGGFGANATQDPELYTRWLQMAALCPIMRPHSDQVVAPEPYTYPEPYKSIVRDYAHLRATLLPYLYTLAAQNTLTGAPLVRAMDFGSSQPSDQAFYASLKAGDDWGNSYFPTEHIKEKEPLGTPDISPANDQYLLGPSLLVAPINQPGQRRRNVVLPATPGGWVDFETGQTLPSGQTVGLAAPLRQIPLLARAGALVPMAAYRANTSEFRPDTLSLRYFPDYKSLNSAFTIYEDDGHSAQAVAQRKYATIQMIGKCGATQTNFWANVTGTYPGAPTKRLVQLRVARVAAAPAAVLLDGQPLVASAWQYDATKHELQLQFLLNQYAMVTLTGLRLLTQPAAQLDPETLTLTAPDSHTFTDEAVIHYTRYTSVGQPETLRIRDQRGQVIRELPTSAALGPQTLRWDGRDAQGHALPAGVYVAEVAGQHQRLLRLPE
ncbi:MAG: TIM-barrel domain-containing protein [Janthinobacterium lividum]